MGAAARSLALAAALIGIVPASALDVSKLQGEMFVAGATTIDPPPNEAKNTHAYITITGVSALRMYQAMRAKAEDDLCREGQKLKRAGNLSCSVGKNVKDASCDFSVDLVKGAIAHGQPC